MQNSLSFDNFFILSFLCKSALISMKILHVGSKKSKKELAKNQHLEFLPIIEKIFCQNTIILC